MCNSWARTGVLQLQDISRQGFIFVEKSDRHNYSMPFPVHSLTLKNAQFDISHFWTSACWYLLILLHIPRNVREPFRMDETLCLTAEDTKEQEWEGSIYKAYWKNEGKITNFSAIVISGTVTFFKSWVKGRILSWCEEYSLTSRVLLCVARLVSKEHLF